MTDAGAKFTYRITAEGVDAVKAAFGELTRMIGAAAGIGGLGYMIENSLKTATNIELMSREAGMSTKAFQEWSYTLQKFGIDQQTASLEMAKFNVAAAQFVTQNSGPGKTAFERLGFSQADVQKGMQNADQFFGTVLGKIGQVKSEAEKLELLKAIFGKGAYDLIGPADAGLAAMKAYREEAERVGVVMDEGMIQKAHEAENRLNTLADILHMKVAIAIDENADAIAHLAEVGINMMPALGKAFEWVADIAGTLRDTVAAIVVSLYDIKEFSLALAGKGTGDLVDPTAAYKNDDAGLRVTIPRSRPPPDNGMTTGDPQAAAAAKAAADQAAALAQANQDVIDTLQQEQDDMGKSAREMAILTAERKLNASASDDEIAAVDELAGKLYDEKKAMEEAKKQSEELRQSFRQAGDDVSQAFEDMSINGKKFGDVLGTLLKQIEQMVYKKTIGDPLSNFISSGLDSLYSAFGGGKASGGPLDPGKWYIAGENGPEPVWGGGAGAFAAGYPGGGGNGGVSIQIFNNTPSQVTPQVRQGADGTQQIMLMIDKATAENVNNPLSRTSIAMKNAANLSPVMF